MRTRRMLTLSGVVLVVAVLSILVWGWRALFVDHPGDSSETVVFHVAPGASLREVARDLVDRGLMGSPWQLRVVARLRGDSRRIRAGDYALEIGASPDRILGILVSGAQITRSVTLPEGWTEAQVVVTLADSLGIARTELEECVTHPLAAWRQRLDLPEGSDLEGYLFPETYRFARGTKAEDVIGTLLQTLEQVIDDSMRTRMAQTGFDLRQTLTLASIIEAEATRDDERTRISAVYHNRLQQGWKLEADPTVAYAVGKIGDRLLLRDLEVDSPYNTYKVTGLPPGPINNPGRASIVAALWPEPGFEAMYFVADGTGGHVFSRTWEEHRRAVQRYRRLQRERSRDGSG